MSTVVSCSDVAIAEAAALAATDLPDASPTETADDNRVRSLAELVGGLMPLTGCRGPLVDMPGAKDVCRGLLLQLRRADSRFEDVRLFIDQAPVCDDLDIEDDLAEREAARLSCSELGDLLDELRRTMFAWLATVGFGTVVELNEAGMQAVRSLALAVPSYREDAGFIVNAAVEYLAAQSVRGGVLAMAEQRRLASLGRRAQGRGQGWPFTDRRGCVLTEHVEYERDADVPAMVQVKGFPRSES